MNRAHEILAGLKVSTDQLDSLREAAARVRRVRGEADGRGRWWRGDVIAPREQAEQAVLTEGRTPA